MNKLQAIKKFLTKKGYDLNEIEAFLNKPQKQYLNLSVREFIKLHPNNAKTVLTNLKDQMTNEAMGA